MDWSFILEFTKLFKKKNGKVKETFWKCYELQTIFQMGLQYAKEIQKEKSNLFKTFHHLLNHLWLLY